MVPYLLAGVTVLACLGYTIINFADEFMEVKQQKEYETDFLKAHDQVLKERPNLPIPLAFEYRDEITLLSLCTEYHKRWKVEYFYNKWIQKHEPKVENDYLAFRRVNREDRPEGSVLVEVVRCNEKYALFASDKKSGYVLTLAKKSTGGTENDTFHIYTCFEYMERPEMLSMELLSSEESAASTTPLTRHHKTAKDEK